MKLLIADDSQAKIDLMKAMLAHFMWPSEPLIAMTTENAMELIDTHNITHALIDFYIPTQNGLAIIAYLKLQNPTARVALVSSSDALENFDAARKAGTEACICTSWQSDEVEKAFGDLINDWMENEVS